MPVIIDKATNQAEIDLILRQLFMLKQDTELIQKLVLKNDSVKKEVVMKNDIGDFVQKIFLFLKNLWK